MKYLEKKNKHERDKCLEFEEDTHSYFYKDQRFTSVTSYISKIFEEFDREKSVYNLMNSKDWKYHELYGKKKEEIFDIWSERNRIAIEKGVILHQDIENYLNKIPIENNSIEFEYFKKFLSENKMNVYRTEWKIFDETLKLAGTIDMCSRNNNGDICIYDWKRSKSIIRKKKYPTFSNLPELYHMENTNFNHYSLQLNLYKYILEKKYNVKVSGMFLVCLHPENKNNDYLLYNVPFLKKEMISLIKFIEENK